MAKVTIDDICIKDIKGYEGLYAVTSCGKVWSYRKQKFVSQWSNGSPYLLVTLKKDGVKKNKRVHVLVAEAYIPNPDPQKYLKVDHENQNPQDNYVSNLRWVDNIINHCNRKNNIAVFDVETCENYCSVASAIRATGVKRSLILKQCDAYHDTHVQTRFVYDADLTEITMFEFISNMINKRRKADKNGKRTRDRPRFRRTV